MARCRRSSHRSQGRSSDGADTRRRSARSWAVPRLDGSGVRVVAGELMTASAASGRLTVGRLANLLGRDQGTVSLAMSRLTAAFLPAGRSRGLAFHSDRIRGRRLRRVGRVELEPILEIVDALPVWQAAVRRTRRAQESPLGLLAKPFPDGSGIGGVHAMPVG